MSIEEDSDFFEFAEDDQDQERDNWKVIVVDDEPEVISVTQLVLKNFVFENKGLALFPAHSAKEAKALLTQHPDAAIILLDVIMEEEDSGLQLVRYIREELGNTAIRVILRTGQPGQFPEQEVVMKYDINDYKSKTELTKDKLYTTVISSLRSFNNIIALRSLNDELEARVQERTRKIQEQKDIIERNSRRLRAGISYAQRIQDSIFPDSELVKQSLPESFFFLRPRDIVSGDFYWMARQKGKIVLAAIDCTGHGVPGALMSLIGADALHSIVNVDQVLKADLILNSLHYEVYTRLRQETDRSHDGMDISLCVIDPFLKIVEFSGARQPLLKVENGKSEVYKGDLTPVGGYLHDRGQRRFRAVRFEYKAGCRLYFFTDGFADQFGGPKGKKYARRKLIRLLHQGSDLSMDQQHRKVAQAFDEWKGDLPQIDDALVMGCKL
jgi:serine phosphatase RsbU (regulator of sigma subunit)